MSREELKAHCEQQIAWCKFWAYGDTEKLNNSKVYQEHILVLELLEQEPKWNVTGHWPVTTEEE